MQYIKVPVNSNGLDLYFLADVYKSLRDRATMVDSCVSLYYIGKMIGAVNALANGTDYSSVLVIVCHI